MLLLDAESGLQPSAVWPSPQVDLSDLSRIGNLAARKNESSIVRPSNKLDPNGCNGPVIIAFPIYREQVLFGVVVLEVDELAKNQQQTLTQLLGWGSAWLQLLSKNNAPQLLITHFATVIEATSRTLQHSSLRASIIDLLSYIARSFSCDRVSYGQHDGHSMQLYALSDSAQIDSRSSLVRRIEAAMDEALDQGTTLSHTTLSENGHSQLLAHERLCAETTQGYAATFLLSNGVSTFAALTFERRQGPAFDQTTTDICNTLTELLGPILDLKRLHDRPLIIKACDQIKNWMAQQLGQENLRSKLVLILSCLLALWLTLSDGVHRVNSIAILEGVDVRELVAPIDGYIK
ncbi:MAG: hypothetical protein HKN42_03910, partial [Granulosicoccus sp.]|nr:hypothetical protein [Granulosicoccus sp.]